MRCPRCRAANPADARFCAACGAPLDLVCPGCQMRNSPDSRFCRSCGGVLAASSSIQVARTAPRAAAAEGTAEPRSGTGGMLDGERRQATVLFGEIADATALAERLGPEAMLALVERFFELALGEVDRYDGMVNQVLSHGFMALFGVPFGHENHARRAVLSALGIQRRLSSEPWAEGSVQVRMGLNTGLVAVARIGRGPETHYTAVGDTTNVAAHLQSRAEPGEILVHESTARLIAGYVRLRAIGPVQVPGKSELVLAHRVLGLGPRRSPLEGLGSRPLTRFVGRDREMAALHDLLTQVQAGASAGEADRALSGFVGRDHELDALRNPTIQVEAGRGQVVGIVGEPGMGKSRLVYEFRRSLAGKRVTYLEGRCLSYGSAIPYLPILDVVRANCGVMETDGPEAITAKVRAGLQEVGIDPDGSARYILQLLAVKEGTESLAVLSPEAIKARTFETLRQWSLRGSQRRPVIFTLEDLHWIDATSEEYLTSLIENLAGASILMLCTYRPGYRPPWVEHSYVTQVSLRRLGQADSLSIVRSVMQCGQVPEGLVRVILDRAEGNPFFLEELAKAVAEHGQPGVDTAVPSTVQGVMMARIDRLSESSRRCCRPPPCSAASSRSVCWARSGTDRARCRPISRS
jgi:class 3 adenylate cyclase